MKSQTTPTKANIVPSLFKVVKIGRKSGRRTVIERNLTEAEAQRVVKRYPNSSRSMVVYTLQRPLSY